MAEQDQETPYVRTNWKELPNVHRFSREAMATTFEIIIQYEDALYARQAADAAFDELGHLEGQLSRYIENSDISRINNLPVGKPLQIGLDAFECLRLSRQIFHETGGAFDVTIGTLLDCWRDQDRNPRIPSDDELRRARRHTGVDLIQLDPLRYTVRVSVSPIRVDLGGVGKGYGVDKMAELLQEWDIRTALIHGGFSSVLALDAPADAPGWPVTLSKPGETKHTLARLNLRRRAVSGSGLQKGWHIIDPRTAKPVAGKVAAWSCSRDAASADALSTAFMVMSPEEIRQYCARHPEVLALVIVQDEQRDDGERVLSFGPWQGAELLR